MGYYKDVWIKLERPEERIPILAGKCTGKELPAVVRGLTPCDTPGGQLGTETCQGCPVAAWRHQQEREMAIARNALAECDNIAEN